MRNIFILFAALLGTVTLNAQDNTREDIQTFQKGDHAVFLGIGFPNTYHTTVKIGGSILGTSDDGKSKSTPMFIMSNEYGLTDNIGIGAYASYFSGTNEILSAAGTIGSIFGSSSSVGESKYKVFSFGGKLTVHKSLSFLKGIDTYANTYVGFNVVKQEDPFVAEGTEINIGGITLNTSDIANTAAKETSHPTFTYEVNAGGRYFFDENFGVYGEAGIGKYLVNIGGIYRF